VDSAKRFVKCDSNDNCTDYDDYYLRTPLIYAAKYGHVEVVRVLLDGGSNVDRANGYGSTALHVAAAYGRLDVCRLLLDWGAKVDRLDKSQDTPLHYAAWEGHLSVVKLLVDSGADVSVKSGDGRTASDLARSKGKKDVADWLDSVRHG
jgi:death-associated protein kinase